MSIEDFLRKEVYVENPHDPSQLANDLSQRFDSKKKWWSKYDGNIVSPIRVREIVKRCIELLEKSNKPTDELGKMGILAVYKIGRVIIDVYSDGLSAGHQLGFLFGKYRYEHSVFL